MPSVTIDNLKDVIACQGLPDEHLQWIIDHSEYHEYADGELIAKYGEPAEVMWISLSDIESAIRAINTVKLDYYLLKPWQPPEEKLFPVVNDLLNQWHALYTSDLDATRIIGYQWSLRSHSLKEFLSGNLVPYIWIDIKHNPEAEKYMLSANAKPADLPLVVFRDGTVMINPSITEYFTCHSPLAQRYLS